MISYINQTSGDQNTFNLIVELLYNVFCIKDFMVSMMLSYLYYFKGKQQIRRDKQRIIISIT
jgi:hypothetical protein